MKVGIWNSFSKSASMWLILLSCISPVSQAQDTDEDNDDGGGWSFAAAVGIEREPGYTGSDVYEVEADFNIQAVYEIENRAYFFNLGEAGIAVMPDNKTRLRALLEYEPGRENDSDPALEGFPEVEDTVELQVDYVRKLNDEISVGGIVQYDILNRGKGLVGFLVAQYEKDLTPLWEFEGRVDLSYGDKDHIQTEVGISDATAATTGFDAYSPSGGYKGITLELGLAYEATEHVSIFGEISIERYGSMMGDSPLIAEAGNDVTTEAALGVRYDF